MKCVNSDFAYNYIRQRILTGEYLPGHSLMTVALSEQIGVSRTPVREALRMLEVEGLVEIHPHVGAQVKSMNCTELRELCGLRLVLESHAAGLAATNRTRADLQEMGYALDGLRQVVERINESKDGSIPLTELVREDIRFHVAVMRAAKNELIKKEILRLHLIHRVVSAPEISGDARAALTEQPERCAVVNCHVQIYDAIEQGDVNGAETAMRSHIESALARAEVRLTAADLTKEVLCYLA